MMSLKAETPTMSLAGTLTEPGPLCSTAPSTIIMHGIIGIPRTCTPDALLVSQPNCWPNK